MQRPDDSAACADCGHEFRVHYKTFTSGPPIYGCGHRIELVSYEHDCCACTGFSILYKPDEEE